MASSATSSVHFPVVPGAVLPDGTLNADLLRREIASDIRNDARYRAEDGMKKRAIHASKDYDEFRSFVAASQLKPVGRSDVADLFTGGAGGGSKSGAPKNKPFRNSGGSRSRSRSRKDSSKRRNRRKERSGGGGDSGDAAASMTKQSAALAKSKSIDTPAAFEREWRRRRCSASPAAALRMLSSLSPEDVPSTVFRVEVDVDALGGILGALSYLVERGRSGKPTVAEEEEGDEATALEVDAALLSLRLSNGSGSGDRDSGDGDGARASSRCTASFVYRWMNTLPRCGRFALNVAFLSEGQRNEADKICGFLEDRAADDMGVETDTEMATAAAFTTEDVEQLRRTYLH